jgi:predicted neuraminidase
MITTTFWLILMSSAAVATFDGKVRQQEDGTYAAYLKPPYQSNHASSIEQLPDGSLALAWFSGVGEGLNRCSIVFSTLPNGTDTWTDAITVSVRDGFSNQNPVVFYDKTSNLLRLYHSQQPANDGESNSRIWELNSTDFGKTWTKPDIFLGADFPGAFPRNRIIEADDGGLLFPIYNAQDQFSITDRSDISRKRWKMIEIEDTHDMVQPTMIRLKDGSLRVWFRDRKQENIYVATSHDDARTFTKPVPSGLPNPNVGIEANVLIRSDYYQNMNHTTAVVLVFNDYNKSNVTKYGRTPLNIALSYDGGVTWPFIKTLQETNDGEKAGSKVEFSYPSVLQTADGYIHVTYTYDRETIKYRRVTESWIRS